MSTFRATFALLAIGPVLMLDAVAAEVPQSALIISVTGEGKAAAAPDVASISTGVSTQAESAKAALEENSSAMEEVLSTLKKHGVAKKDVQTSNFSVNPVYKQSRNGDTEPEVVAYRANNQVQVRIRKIETLGEVLDALVQSGSNQITGIGFEVGDPAELLEDARRDAIRDAKRRAQVYAQAAEVELGPVRQISEQPIELPRPMQFGTELRAAASRVPIATGEHEYQVTVNVVYDLLRPSENESQ